MPRRRWVTLYRVVDPIELSYLQVHGNYGSNPSRSGKYFAFTLRGAQAFARASMNAGATVTRMTLPQSVVDLGFNLIDPGLQRAGPSIFYDETQLPNVYATMTPPVVL